MVTSTDLKRPRDSALTKVLGKRHLIQHVPVDAVSLDDVFEVVEAAVLLAQQISIFAMNPEKVVKANRDPALKALLSSAEILIPDGIGVVFGLRQLGVPAQRLPGSELMPALCERAATRGWPVYLLGASEEVNARAVSCLQQRYPALCIAGHHHGFFSGADVPTLLNDINASGAKILFVALGSPRQEEWIQAHRRELKVPVMQGVGGTFDVIAGNVKRAPAAWRKLNLEWAYRLLSQPSRVLRQRALLGFALSLVRQRLQRG